MALLDDSCGLSPLSDNIINALQKLPRLEQLSLTQEDLRQILHDGKFDVFTKFQSLACIQCLGDFGINKIREEFERLRVPKEVSDKVTFVRTRQDEEMYVVSSSKTFLLR